MDFQGPSRGTNLKQPRQAVFPRQEVSNALLSKHALLRPATLDEVLPSQSFGPVGGMVEHLRLGHTLLLLPNYNCRCVQQRLALGKSAALNGSRALREDPKSVAIDPTKLNPPCFTCPGEPSFQLYVLTHAEHCGKVHTQVFDPRRWHSSIACPGFHKPGCSHPSTPCDATRQCSGEASQGQKACNILQPAQAGSLLQTSCIGLTLADLETGGAASLTVNALAKKRHRSGLGHPAARHQMPHWPVKGCSATSSRELAREQHRLVFENGCC